MYKTAIIIFLLLNVHLQSVAQNPKLVFSAHWMPQAQFAGYYAAQDQGFYEAAGLDVEIIHPSAAVNAVEFLKTGQADIISLFLMTGIEVRQKGLDLVNIAQLSQHSAIMFVAHKNSGIESIEDFNGKHVGVWMSGFEELPRAMMQKYGVEVEWVPILSTVNLFLLGGIDVMTVMYYNEYNQIYLSGIDRDELNTFFAADYGFNIPEDGLYTLRHTALNRNADLRAFTEATLRGWAFAAENKDYVLELVLDQMHKNKIPANIAHQSWMLDKVLDLIDLGNDNQLAGKLNKDDFLHASDIIRSQHNIDFQLDYNDFFKPALELPQSNE